MLFYQVSLQAQASYEGRRFCMHSTQYLQGVGSGSGSVLLKVSQLSFWWTGRNQYVQKQTKANTVLLMSAIWRHKFQNFKWCPVGRDSVVPIATRQGLDGRGIQSRWGRDFLQKLDRSCGPSNILYDVYRVSFPGVKRPGVALATHRHLASCTKKMVVPLLPVWAFEACSRLKFTFNL